MITSNTNRQRFSLGRIVATPAALDALAKSGDSAHALFARHASGDFGTVCRADWQANEQAIHSGERVFSAYLLRDGAKVWIITEADRASTCLLLPEDY